MVHGAENEHVTMRPAGIVGMEVPPCGLFRLKDGSLAYLVLRFDRMPNLQSPMQSAQPAQQGHVKVGLIRGQTYKSPKFSSIEFIEFR